MSSRRQNRVSTLAIVLPHPPIVHRRSSFLSQGSITSPHTPRTSSCGSPTCQSWLFTNNNNHRKSTDSWNSSNQDVGEDCESEWKPEQVLLLSRTLDALPSHLVTPFNGPIPPSNLLDKIARGVANAKGPAEWPHSLRATRVKLIEIARQRAREESRFTVADENDEISCYSADSDVNVGFKNPRGIARRPIHRQSSMDFIKNTDDRKGNNNITRLSTRLQRTENLIPNPSYHPYTRSRARAQTQSQAQPQSQMNRRSSSPPRSAHVPSLISPSTPSSTTLNSLSSISTSAARSHFIRRPASSLSTTTDSSMISGHRSLADSSELEPHHLLPSVLPGPVQRIKRSESFCVAPHSASRDDFSFPIASNGTPPPSRHGFKRAPSYGALAQETREKEKEKRASGMYAQTYGTKSREEMNVSPCPSSDEEEKQRNKQAKKSRGPGGKAASPDSDKGKAKKRTKAKEATCAESKPASSRRSTPPASGSASAPAPPPAVRPQRMNLQRNPSMFGDELPHLHIPAASSRPAASITSSSSSSVHPPPPATPASPETPRKTLRRVKRLAPSRRISFGSLVSPSNGNTAVEDNGEQRSPKLGSAFQLS